MKKLNEVPQDRMPASIRLDAEKFDDGIHYTLMNVGENGSGWGLGVVFYDAIRARRAGEKIAEALGAKFDDTTKSAVRS